MTVRNIEELSKQELIELVFKQQEFYQDKIHVLERTLEGANRNYEELLEKYKLVVAAKYQSQKKMETPDGVEQLSLFNDAEDEALRAQEEEKDAETETVVKSYTRTNKKKKRIRFDQLRREVITLEPSEEDRVCSKCGGKMKIKCYIKEEELVYIPGEWVVHEYRIPEMECEHCQEHNEDGKSTYKLAECNGWRKLIPGSLASPGLISHIITQKFDIGVPFYTLEKVFERDGIFISRQNMANWLLYIASYIAPLYNLMMADLKKHNLIHADETHTQVIKEPGRSGTSTSFMWVFRTGANDIPIVMYVYSPSRSGDVAKDVLDGWSGLLETDAYTGYNKVEGAIRCLCNVHALRKFKDAYKLIPKGTSGKKSSDEAKAVQKYQKLFSIEHKIQKEADNRRLTGDERFKYVREQRQNRLKQPFEKFLVWLKEISPMHIGKRTMTEAINYVFNNQEGLMRFLDYGEAPMSNQLTEQSIRPFVVIRNRCKFHFSMAGADTSAMLYSLMITAKANGRHPYGYFQYILEKLPGIDPNNEEELRKLLPYSRDLPERTKVLTRKEIEDILQDA